MSLFFGPLWVTQKFFLAHEFLIFISYPSNDRFVQPVS
jgi:hypothetical protein